MRHRRAQLLATAALIAALTPIVVAGGPIDSMHKIRDALIETGSRFHNLPDILTGSLTNSLNLHKGLPL
jgi:hypothetical protein